MTRPPYLVTITLVLSLCIAAWSVWDLTFLFERTSHNPSCEAAIQFRIESLACTDTNTLVHPSMLRKHYHRIARDAIMHRLVDRQKWDLSVFSKLRETPRRIFLIFYYNGEAASLEMNIGTLQNIVDYFVLIESNVTFQKNVAREPRLLWRNQKDRFPSSCLKRFIHVQFETGIRLWQYQGLFIMTGLWGPMFRKIAEKNPELAPQPEDIVAFVQADEIWRPEALWLLKWTSPLPAMPLGHTTVDYYGSFKWFVRSDRRLESRTLLRSSLPLYIPQNTPWPSAVLLLKDAAWHCSGCMPYEEFRYKFLAAADPGEQAVSEEEWKNLIHNGVVPSSIDVVWHKSYGMQEAPILHDWNEDLPEWFQIHKDRYSFMWETEPKEILQMWKPPNNKYMPLGFECETKSGQYYFEINVNMPEERALSAQLVRPGTKPE